MLKGQLALNDRLEHKSELEDELNSF